MHARDVMTTQVVTVTADTRVTEIAKLLLERRISAVPVVDAGNRLIGIVSEGDLTRRAETGTEHRRSWWLSLMTGEEQLARDYTKAHGSRAADVMTRTVATVSEETPINEVARLLEERRIKRVPVVREGQVVGIVSRADLLRGLIAQGERLAAPPSLDDRAIRDQLLETMRREGLRVAHVNVVVTDGVAHLWGLVGSDEQRRAIRVAAENAPGVRAVEDHLGTEPRLMWAD